MPNFLHFDVVIYRVDLAHIDTRSRVQLLGWVDWYDPNRVFVHFGFSWEPSWSNIPSIYYSVSCLVYSRLCSASAAVSSDRTFEKVRHHRPPR